MRSRYGSIAAVAIVAGILVAPLSSPGGRAWASTPPEPIVVTPDATTGPSPPPATESAQTTPAQPAPPPSQPETPSTSPPGTDVAADGSIPGTTTPDDNASEAISPELRRSSIPLITIGVAVFVLLAVAFAARRIAGRSSPEIDDGLATAAGGPGDGSDAETVQFIVELGQALINSSSTVGDVETELQAIARTNGIARFDVVVFPTALMASVQEGDQVVTQVGTAGTVQLRLDQIDDITHLVNDARTGAVSPTRGRADLAAILTSTPRYAPTRMLAGYALSSIGLALILHADWRGVLLAAVLGVAVGWLRMSTRQLGNAYQPFWPMIAAAISAVVVFATARAATDLIVFPALVAPIVMFLPGALLTTGVLELATGHIVAGASRVASGGMQLVLLALGIVAGAQLVGTPAADLDSSETYSIGVLAPWAGVALFAVGVSWFNNARRAAQVWIAVVLCVAYAGQVLGGLFFGSALSAFFGALAMTPVAVLASRQPTGPAPLVTFLPGFWLLVPGSLGLEGVTRIIGADGYNANDVLTTTLTSMIGISLGILLGLTVATRNRTLVDTTGTRAE